MRKEIKMAYGYRYTCELITIAIVATVIAAGFALAAFAEVNSNTPVWISLWGAGTSVALISYMINHLYRRCSFRAKWGFPNTWLNKKYVYKVITDHKTPVLFRGGKRLTVVSYYPTRGGYKRDGEFEIQMHPQNNTDSVRVGYFLALLGDSFLYITQEVICVDGEDINPATNARQ